MRVVCAGEMLVDIFVRPVERVPFVEKYFSQGAAPVSAPPFTKN